METNLRFMVASLVAVLLSTASFAQSAGVVLGTWLNEEKEARIEIYPQNKQYFGKIVWLSQPDNASGTPKLDDKNPDPSRRNQPILGSILMRDFTYNGKGIWENGTIYDGRSGTTYKCRLQVKDPNTLTVRGYIGAAWMGLGKTTTWTRVK